MPCWICAYDADLQGVAQRYFFHALRMAKASGDPGFGGYVVALLANQALYLGLYRQVIQYAETALRGARQYLSPALVTDLSTMQALAYSVERTLRSRFFRIPSETRIGILGYGSVGEAVATSIVGMGAQVLIYDPSPIRMARALVEGLAAMDRSVVLRESDVLIGLSGQRSVTADDVTLLKNGVILASGSSKQVEIDVNGLSLAAGNITADRGLTRLAIGKKTIWLLDDGVPINFADQGVLGHVLDLIYTELYICIRKLSEGRCDKGLQALDRIEQEAIADVWQRFYRRPLGYL